MAWSKREGPQFPLLDPSGLAGGRRVDKAGCGSYGLFLNPLTDPGQEAWIYILSSKTWTPGVQV